MEIRVDRPREDSVWLKNYWKDEDINSNSIAQGSSKSLPHHCPRSPPPSPYPFPSWEYADLSHCYAKIQFFKWTEWIFSALIHVICAPWSIAVEKICIKLRISYVMNLKNIMFALFFKCIDDKSSWLSDALQINSILFYTSFKKIWINEEKV